MKQTTFQMAVAKDGKPHLVEATGYESGVSGLVVHHPYNWWTGSQWPTHWVVSYAAVGQLLGTTEFERRATAVRFAQRLGELVDWTQPVEVLQQWTEGHVELVRETLAWGRELVEKEG